MPEFAGRLDEIEAFKAMKVLNRANELEAQGKNIIHLEVGEPDFPTPDPIVDAAKQALDAPSHTYTLDSINPKSKESSSHLASKQ